MKAKLWMLCLQPSVLSVVFTFSMPAQSHINDCIITLTLSALQYYTCKTSQVGITQISV